MKLKIDINEAYEETQITIQTKKWTKELEELVQKLEQPVPKRIIGYENDQSILLSPRNIDYIFAENRKVFACCGKKTFEIKMKLYEAETLLASYDFIRLSKSAIGNVNQMSHFELSFNGSLCVYFHSGTKEYVSRKYVNDLKNKLILGADPNGK